MKKTFLYTPTSKTTCVFLVLLRLAIGWHLFIEGAVKLESFAVGPTGTNKPFSSRGYLLQSQGILSPYFRRLAGDPDDFLLTLLDSRNGEVPAALKAQWEDFVQRYITLYRFDADLQAKANELLKQHLARLAEWFLQGSREVNRDYSFATITPTLTTAERINEYRRKLQELRDRINGWNLRFDKDVSKVQIASLKSDVARLRTELLKDLDDQQLNLEQDLDKLLKVPHLLLLYAELYKMGQAVGSKQGYSREQQGIAELIQAAQDANAVIKAKPEIWANVKKDPMELMQHYLKDPDFRNKLLLVAKRLVCPPLRIEDTSQLDQADQIVVWGLTLAGLGLLLGCFTRLSCVAGAILLLLFYLSLPPLPGLPDNPMAEGKYLFVNKNLIEALALLALATTASGRWFGFDGLLSMFIPFKYLWPKPQLVQVVEPDPKTPVMEQPVPAAPESAPKE